MTEASTDVRTAYVEPNGRRRPRRRISRIGYLLSLPYVVLLAGLGVFPTLYAAYLSVLDEDGNFTGAWNYALLLQDHRLLPAVLHVLTYLAIWLPLMTVLVLGLSFLLQARPGPVTSGMKLLYYLPGAFTGSAAVLLWLFILDPGVGPFNALLSMFGAEYISDVVTTDRLPVIFALMAFTAGAGSWIVIMYGALNGVSTEIMESARLDGANRWQLATQIQLPLIRKYVVYMLVLTISAGLQIYVEPQILNPLLHVGSTPESTGETWSINQLALFLGVLEGDAGRASALSLMLLVVALAIGLFLIFRTDFFDLKERDK